MGGHAALILWVNSNSLITGDYTLPYAIDWLYPASAKKKSQDWNAWLDTRLDHQQQIELKRALDIRLPSKERGIVRVYDNSGCVLVDPSRNDHWKLEEIALLRDLEDSLPVRTFEKWQFWHSQNMRQSTS